MTTTFLHLPRLQRAPLAALLLGLALLLAACGRGSEAAAAQIRTPHPTFTPTPLGQGGAPAPVATVPPIVPGVTMAGTTANTAMDGAAAPGEPVVTSPPAEAAAPAATPPPAPTATAPSGLPAVLPQALVNTELVNARQGPGTDFPVVIVLGINETYDVTGKDATGGWWRVCCVEEQDAWVAIEFVDVQGATDGLPVAAAGEQSGIAQAGAAAPAAPAPTAAALAPATTAATAAVAPPAATQEATAAPAPDAEAATAPAAGGAGAFELIAQERFPETNVVRVFLYVYDATGALEGYTLRVTKEGAEQTVAGQSFGGRAGLTWPLADDRQRSQNFKAEFPGVSPAGTWTVELAQGGVAVGPAATFTLQENDPNRELYVRYEKQ